MRLGEDFFRSSVWLEARRFSRQEALLDLAHLWEVDWRVDEVALAHRWGWKLQEVVGFHKQLLSRGFLKNWRPVRVSGLALERGANHLVVELHDIYNQSFSRRLSLTKDRIAAYQRLISSGLTDAGQARATDLFRRICIKVREDEFLMSKVAYHDPASLFRNDTRASRWLEEAQSSTNVTPEQERERLIVDEFHEAQADPGSEGTTYSENELRQIYDTLPPETQQQIVKTFEIKRARYAQFGAFREEAERALLWRLVLEADGASE
jgi:hypothetical protein